MIFKPVYTGCRVSRELREKFKSAAKANNTTPSKLLRRFIKGYVEGK